MDICSFLSKSYTAYHAVRHSVFILEKHGFCELNLADAWKLQKGGKYYVTKNGSCVIAFVVGDNFAFNIAGSHTDSPSLHVKGNELVDSCEGKRVNVEKYGGPILYSFIDAPLKSQAESSKNTTANSFKKWSKATTSSRYRPLRYTTTPQSTTDSP